MQWISEFLDGQEIRQLCGYEETRGIGHRPYDKESDGASQSIYDQEISHGLCSQLMWSTNLSLLTYAKLTNLLVN